MATFVMLVNFTEQGIRNIKDTIGRAKAFQDTAKKSGVTLKELCWARGRYDVIAMFEAPDEDTAMALVYSATSLGNTKAELLRTFDFEDMSRILAKMA